MSKKHIYSMIMMICNICIYGTAAARLLLAAFAALAAQRAVGDGLWSEWLSFARACRMWRGGRHGRRAVMIMIDNTSPHTQTVPASSIGACDVMPDDDRSISPARSAVAGEHRIAVKLLLGPGKTFSVAVIMWPGWGRFILSQPWGDGQTGDVEFLSSSCIIVVGGMLL